MMNELVLINSSRSLQTESVIRFVVSLHLILQICVRILQNLQLLEPNLYIQNFTKACLVPKFQKVTQFFF